MHPPSLRPRGRSRSLAAWPCLALAASALLAAGCEEKPAEKQPEYIVGKRTQVVKDANAELKSGKAKVGTTKITAKDPITLQGNAYVTMVGRIGQLQIEDALNKYYALNERYPKDLEEFMNEIIKPNNIALPKLPYYQEYGYDPKEHKLIILEYPDRKNQPPQ
jgi:hypothetical protein